ncbi:HD domain-containing protein [bacterium]|nr:HD domain-containing protein [bacterium]
MILTPLNLVNAGSIVAMDVSAGAGRALVKKGVQITSRDLEDLHRRGITHIYIEDGNELSTKPDGTISEATRQIALDAVTDLFDHIEDFRRFNLSRVKIAAERMVDDILANEEINVQVQDIRQHDDYTFKHSVNVTALSLALGRRAGLPRDELMVLALGGLMHDIGKKMVPLEILNKPSRLTDEEKRAIEEHTTKGFEILSQHTNTDPVIWSLARQHHESLDGTGYPDRRKGKDIHNLARMLQIVDQWDALRSVRPYKPAWSNERVIHTIRSSGETGRMDPAYVKLFLKMVVPYPQGTVVQLADGRMASVVAVNRHDPARPVVMLLSDRNGRPVPEDQRTHLELLQEPPETAIVKSLS